MGKFKTSETMSKYIGRTYKRRQVQGTDVMTLKKQRAGMEKTTRTGAETGESKGDK